MKEITIKDAWETNLKHIDVQIPKQKFTVLSGVSGSGKSTLAVDVLFQECQRQYLEAMGMQGIPKPKVEKISHISPAILIAQKQQENRNPRSSVGTLSNLYTDLRMIFEKIGSYPCPHCQNILKPYECKETLVKKDQDFHVYQTCTHCGKTMDKLTRTYFSYNTREGACPTCSGMGKIWEVDISAIIDPEIPYAQGIHIWEHKYLAYQMENFQRSLTYYNLPLSSNTPFSAFSQPQKDLLLYGSDSIQMKQHVPDLLPPASIAKGKFEGMIPFLEKKLSEQKNTVMKFFTERVCPDCHGDRLCETSRQVIVEKKRLPQLANLTLEEGLEWIQDVKEHIPGEALIQVESYLLDMETKIKRLVDVGLGYLSMDRTCSTLSGGETQRMKLAAALDCELEGMLYVMDEPTIGLHPQDTKGVVKIIKKLRDLGNTILVIEHDPALIKEADQIIEIGNGAGRYGGSIIAQGTPSEILQNAHSQIAPFLRQSHTFTHVPRNLSQPPLHIKNACKHNLKHIDVRIPMGGIIAITGVSGAGKSTFVFDVIAKAKSTDKESNLVEGLEQFDKIIQIRQQGIVRMNRSNVATSSGVYASIRTLFAKTAQAKASGFTAKHFSFNTPGGRCERCAGLGTITSNLLFFEDLEVPCPLCHGNRFQPEILAITYQGYSIKDILDMEIHEAITVFKTHPDIQDTLQILLDCGLGYLTLGQSLTTLSGGELQRLKLAKELSEQSTSHNLYLIDEPTIGLHPLDIENFLVLLARLADQGNTILIVEHNEQVICASDYVLDFGPGGGIHGGQVIAQGTPEELRKNKNSITGAYL